MDHKILINLNKVDLKNVEILNNLHLTWENSQVHSCKPTCLYKAGIRKCITFHTARETFITNSIMLGVNIKERTLK